METTGFMDDLTKNSPQPLIALEHVSRQISPSAGIYDVSLDVNQGQILALVGHTGAGKTSLLNLIAGLDDLDKGRILLSGTDAKRLRPHQRGISMIFQNDVFYPGRPLEKDWNEAASKGILNRWNVAGINPQEMLETLQISALMLRQKPETFSGGQARRASLLRALLQDRPMILADEPLGGLDLWARDRVSRLIWQFIKTTRKSMIVVVHEPAEAFGLADTIAVLKAGRLLPPGSPEEMIHNPQHIEIARLLHFPPINDISQFLAGNGQVISMVPVKSSWIDFHPDSIGQIKDLMRLRNRTTQNGNFTEWRCPVSKRIFWTPALANPINHGRLCWENEAVMHFDAATGQRLPAQPTH